MKACRRLICTQGNTHAHCGDQVVADGKKCLALCEECVHLNFPDKPTPNCQCPACLFERIGRQHQMAPERMAAAAWRAIKQLHPNYDPGAAVMNQADTMFDTVMAQITGMTGQKAQ